MALSQIQCLDDNHVNPRTHESKPEFLYCENQRLALEALLQDGREAFFKYLEVRGLRGFLSDPELETLSGAVEPFDPGMDLFPDNAEDDEPPLSQHYWPEMSDTSIPQMDLGWPDTEAYRGVTRTTIYSQPPLDGQAHIKEVVRKMIAQAQKVIAVVMDVFTDVDIFRDLLDAGFKRRVSIYILLERTALPHFLSMCQRANMHAGHLKHLRVRYTDGLEFHTRSSLKVRGRMGHRFMFIDGDKAVSGSYSFTWMSSRLERSLITVITGQAVDAFDRLFRILYASSSWADLRRVAMEPEPEPERLPQVASVAPPSAAVARKLYNPKYALALGNPSPSPSLTPSDGHNSPKKTQSPENSRNADTKKGRRRRPSQEAVQEAPPIHPGLVDLEKACLMAYLPTWPEPDPPSDVIGFINIRDTSKPIQVHLQRSEMFGTSQAIKFSSPISMPKETLPEVAKPRQLTTKHEEVNKLQPAQVKTKAETSVADRTQPTQLNARPDDIKSKAEAPEQNSPAPGPKCESDKDTAKTLNAGDKLHLKTPTNQDAAILHLNKHAPPESSGKASIPDAVRPSHTTQAVTANKPKPDSLPGLNTKEAEASLNTQNDVVYRTHTPESNSPSDSNAEQRTQTKTVMPHTDSHTQVVHTQPQKSAEFTSNNQTINIKSHTSPSSTSTTCTSTSFSENNHVSITTGMTTSDCALNPPLPSSSASSTPPMPKPRTIQLVIKDGVAGDGQKLPEVSVVRRPQTSTGLLVVHDEPAAATVAQTSPEKEPETVPELQNNKGSKTGAQKDAANTGNIGEASQQKQSGTSQETKNEEAVGLHHDRAGMQLVTGNNLDAQSDVLITDAPKAESVNIQEIIPKDVEPKTLTSIGCKSIDCAATVEAGTKAPERALTGCEFAEVPKEDSKNVTQPKAHHAYTHELQTTLYYVLTPQDKDILEDVGSKAPSHAPVSPTDIADDSTHTFAADTHGQPGEPSFTPAQSMPDTVKHSTSSIFEELIPEVGGSTNAPEKPLCLLLSDVHKPDLHSLSPERESQSPAAPVRHPPSDEFLPRTPTPDSQTRTPDPQSCTPDFQMPPPKNTGNIGGASQRKHSVTSQQTKNEEAVGLHHDRAGMQLVTGNKLDAQSDVLITDAPKAESVNIQEIIPKDVEPKTLTSIGCKLTPQIDSVATVGAGSKAPERALTGCEFALVPNANSKNVTQPKTYHAYTHEHQRISYGEFTPTHTPVSPTRNLHMSKDTAHDSTHTSAADTQGQQGNPSFSPAQSIPDTVKQSTSSAFQELIPQAGGSTNTPEKPLPLPLSDMPKADVCLLSPEKELRSLMVLVRTPTPDGFLPSTPTPASRTHTPDPRSHTPDFRTPTPEISDGYVSPRPDSVLSTTSEEYYECSDSPFHEPVLCFTHTNTTNSTSVATSPVYINYKSLAAVLGTTDKNSSCSETQSLSRPDSVSSLSSLPEKKAKMEEEEKEETANEKHGRKVDKKGKKLSVAERRTEGDSQGTQRRGSVEAKRTVDHSKQCKDSTETVEKNKEAQPQTPKRKRVSSQSAAERLVDGGVTSGLTNEGAEPKQLSTGDLKPKKLSSEGERPDKDKAVDRAALGPSSVERRGRAHARETEGAKLLHTPPRPLRGQQQDSRVASPSRPSRSPRSRSASQSSGARSWGSRHLSQTESKMLHSGVQVLDNSSSSRRLPSRPPPPILTGAVRSAAGRRQAEVSQSLLSRQPLAAQGRARGGCSQEAQGQEEGKSPFSFTFSRLYSLRGMRDKVGRLPSQGKRDSSSPPVQGRKSTS